MNQYKRIVLIAVAVSCVCFFSCSERKMFGRAEKIYANKDMSEYPEAIKILRDLLKVNNEYEGAEQLLIKIYREMIKNDYRDSRIVYITKERKPALYYPDTGKKHTVNIDLECYHPALSPDGKMIAFSAVDSDGFSRKEIYIYHLASGTLEKVSDFHEPEKFDYHIDWALDSRQFVYLKGNKLVIYDLQSRETSIAFDGGKYVELGNIHDAAYDAAGQACVFLSGKNIWSYRKGRLEKLDFTLKENDVYIPGNISQMFQGYYESFTYSAEKNILTLKKPLSKTHMLLAPGRKGEFYGDDEPSWSFDYKYFVISNNERLEIVPADLENDDRFESGNKKYPNDWFMKLYPVIYIADGIEPHWGGKRFYSHINPKTD